MEAFETFQHEGCTIRLYQDEDPSSPADWDQLGTLAAFSPLRRDYLAPLGAPDALGLEDAADRGRGFALAARYARLCHGAIVVPFTFSEFGSGAGQLRAAGNDTDRAAGYIFTTHERVTELCGDSPEYHEPAWIENALRGELEEWGQYVAGEVYGFTVEDDSGVADSESLWGIYDDGRDEDSRRYVGLWDSCLGREARATAESLAHERDERRESARGWSYLHAAS